jgi:hypothetical protein
MLHIVKREGPLTRKDEIKVTGEGFDNKAIAVGEQAPKTNSASDTKPQPIVNNEPKVGRNDPCPCRQPVRNIKTAVVEISNSKGYRKEFDKKESTC